MDEPSLSSATWRTSIQRHLSDIAAHGQALLSEDPTARAKLIARARSMILALETPLETVTWIAWAEPTRQAALRIAIDIGLFELLIKHDGIAKTKDALASELGGDARFISRLLKHLASMEVINEVDVDRYEPTNIARVLTIPKYRDAIPFCAETAGPVFQKLPAYFAKKQYVPPSDISDGPFQYGHDTKLNIWQWRSERPQLEQAFNNHMAGYHQGRPSWMDDGFYPVKARLGEGMKLDRQAVAIVDVGGNVGYDLQELKQKHPDLPGRFVLQDRAEVIEQVVDIDESIECFSHDFFTEQNIKGARAYYMHSILHDWSDTDCCRILQHIAGAMEKGYSKLLINENIVPDQGADWKITSLDWFMMALAASAERTQAQWTELLRSAGFKITGIWTTDSAVESLIEAVLEEDA